MRKIILIGMIVILARSVAFADTYVTVTKNDEVTDKRDVQVRQSTPRADKETVWTLRALDVHRTRRATASLLL